MYILDTKLASCHRGSDGGGGITIERLRDPSANQEPKSSQQQSVSRLLRVKSERERRVSEPRGERQRKKTVTEGSSEAQVQKNKTRAAASCLLTLQ